MPEEIKPYSIFMLRASSLDMCRRELWYLQHHRMEPEKYPMAPQHWWFIAGRAKHNLFFQCMMNMQPNYEKCLEGVMDNPDEMNPYLRMKIMQELNDTVPLFQNWYQNTAIKIQNIKALEPTMYGKIGGKLISGHPDVFLTDDCILDFKTGKQFHPDAYYKQLALYRELGRLYDGKVRDCWIIMISKSLITKKNTRPWKEVYMEPKELDKYLEELKTTGIPETVELVESIDPPPAEVGTLCISCPARSWCIGI